MNQNSTSIYHFTEEFIDYLAYGNLWPIFTIFHIIYSCLKFRPLLYNQYWLFSLIILTIACSGGSTIIGYILCKPPPWWKHDFYFVYVLIFWYLIMYRPGKPLADFLNLIPSKSIIMIFETILTVRSVFSSQELIVQELGGVVAPIVLGSIGGFGGTLIGNFLTKLVQDPNTPSELSRPTWALKSGFYMSLAYFILGPHGSILFGEPLIEDLWLRLGIIVLMVFHSLSETITKTSYIPMPIRLLETALFHVSGVFSEKSKEE